MKKLTEKHDGPVKGEKLEINISALDEDCVGVGVIDAAQIRVSGALPGERVLARVTYTSRHRVTAERIKILTRSKDRIPSPCRYTPACDGCPLIELSYNEQLKWKENHVAKHIRQHAELQKTEITPVQPSPKQLQYRNSAKLIIAGKFSDPVIGFYKRNSHEVIDIADCPLHHPLINRIAAAVKRSIKKGKVQVYSPKSEHGLLRYLVVKVSESDNSAMVILVTSKRSFNELHHMASYLKKEVPEVTVVVQNVNSSTGNAILGNTNYFQTKATSIKAEIAGVKFLLSPGSFFQVNSHSAAIIYNLVREYASLQKGGTALDLYCGVGAISLFLSPVVSGVLGIEVVEAAVEDATKNARLNHFKNCEFVAGDAAHEISSVAASGTKIDLVVLNPPRKGCDEKVLEQVAALAPTRMVYVSCSPASLGRDLVKLYALGYDTRKITPVDMFPQTPHVESVALLERR